jgi:chromosome segregation ATPase
MSTPKETLAQRLARIAAEITAQTTVVDTAKTNLKKAQQDVTSAQKALVAAQKALAAAETTLDKEQGKLDRLNAQATNASTPKPATKAAPATKLPAASTPKPAAVTSNGNGNGSHQPGFLRQLVNYLSAADVATPEKPPQTAKK